MCIRVDSPEPEGADDRGHAALLNVERDAAQRINVGVALAAALDEIARRDDTQRGRRRRGEGYTGIDGLLLRLPSRSLSRS